MLSNYFTLKALVTEWAHWVPGSQVREIYSQSRGELTISICTPKDELHSLRINTKSPGTSIYFYEGQNRAKKNTLSFFPDVLSDSEKITAVSIAPGDRQITFALESGCAIRIDLYGSRANIYLLDKSGVVSDRFRQIGTPVGHTPPAARPRATMLLRDELAVKIESLSGSLEKRIQRIISTFDSQLATEVVYRFDPAHVGKEPAESLDVASLHETIEAIVEELDVPSPHIYFDSEGVIAATPIKLKSLVDFKEDSFSSMNSVVHLFARSVFSRSAFKRRYDPVESGLKKQLDKSLKRLERMREELAKPSRADQYEVFGHLLMALQNDVPSGADRVTLPDIIENSGDLAIKLDEQKNAVQNAERYYEKARRTRAARKSAESRVNEESDRVDRLRYLVKKLEAVESTHDVDDFRKRYKEELDQVLSVQGQEKSVVPYRQFLLPNDFVVWVGRSAAQNDELTTRSARKFDYWLHARGVSGSHVVLRVPKRDIRPPRSILEQAASIAAFFSKAKTSALVPVICTQKKFVRKPRKSLPGAVLVEREEVLMVEPILPVQQSDKSL